MTTIPDRQPGAHVDVQAVGLAVRALRTFGTDAMDRTTTAAALLAMWRYRTSLTRDAAIAVLNHFPERERDRS